MEPFLRTRVSLYTLHSASNTKVDTSFEETNTFIPKQTKNRINTTILTGAANYLIYHPGSERDLGGTGFSWIRHVIEQDDHMDGKYIISLGARIILKQLLNTNPGFVLPGDGPVSLSSSLPITPASITVLDTVEAFHIKDNNTNSMLAEGTISLTGQYVGTSTFMSILHIIHNGKGKVKIKTFSDSVNVRVACIPMEMDASDVINVALDFLSRTEQELKLQQQQWNGTNCSLYPANHFPYMPLIVCDGDTYHMQLYSMSLDDIDFEKKVLNLENIFYSSTMEYLGRLRFCPRYDSEGKERMLMISGINEKTYHDTEGRKVGRNKRKFSAKSEY